MKKLLKTLLTYKFRTQKLPKKKGGFTLIELLVGLIMGALIITPLLGFVINVMSSDRQEQAKSASEQEVQTALDYIGRDLSQAIFIYDGLGLESISAKLPDAPTGTEGAPVLVFWKREFLKDVLDKGAAKDDAFVMSLVAYYQIKDPTCTNTSTWSCTTRIGRVEIKDGVRNTAGTVDPVTGQLPYLDNYGPDPGFSNPLASPVGGGTPVATRSFEQKMNAWTPGPGDINRNNMETLIDFVDQTPFATAGLTEPFCPVTGRVTPRPDVPEPATDFDPTTPYTKRTVPNYTGAGAVPASLQTGSFYGCVSTDKTIAQVFIRGNALARNSPRNNPPTYCPNGPKTFDCSNTSAFFPKANIQVQGRGLITENSSN